MLNGAMEEPELGTGGFTIFFLLEVDARWDMLGPLLGGSSQLVSG